LSQKGGLLPKNLGVFRSFLTIELDNLVDAIHQLIAACNEKCNRHAISHKVLLENSAFFQKEIWGISSFNEFIKQYDMTGIEGEEDMARVLKERFTDWVQTHDLPPALIPLVNLKIDKVLRYVNQEKDTAAGSNP
jgi:hypothetical protein